MKSLVKQLIYFDFRNSYSSRNCERYSLLTSKGTCKMGDNDTREAFIILSDDILITIRVALSLMRVKIKCKSKEETLRTFDQLSDSSFYLCSRKLGYEWI